MTKRACATVIALFAAGVAAGCGGNEEPLSKAEYINQGDAICKEAAEAIDFAAKRFYADLGLDEDSSVDELTALTEEFPKFIGTSPSRSWRLNSQTCATCPHRRVTRTTGLHLRTRGEGAREGRRGPQGHL